MPHPRWPKPPRPGGGSGIPEQRGIHQTPDAPRAGQQAVDRRSGIGHTAQVTYGGSCELTFNTAIGRCVAFGLRPHREGLVRRHRSRSSAPNRLPVDSVRPDQGADIYRSDLFEPASHFAVTAAWIAGAVAVAYVLSLGLSWTVQRLSRRSAILRDIAHLTRQAGARHPYGDRGLRGGPQGSPTLRRVGAAGSTMRWSSR